MINKNKIFLIGILCLVGLAGFMVATNNADTDEVISGFKSTTNGSYFDKHLRIAQDIELPGETKDNGSSNTGGAYVEVPVPDDLSSQSLIAWVDSLNICDTRKSIIRNGLEIKEQAYYSINHHANWTVDNLAGQGIECSGFIAWSCRRAGVDAFGAPTTAGIASHLELTTNPKPGDFGNVTAQERKDHGVNAQFGHIGIYLGKQASGEVIYLHAGGSTSNATPTPKVSAHSQITDWGHTYTHPDIKAADAVYESSHGSSSSSGSTTTVTGTNLVAWDDSWQYAKPAMKHPDALNKYVPDNFNGHTVFVNPGHGDGSALASEIPNDPFGSVSNQYAGSASRGHTTGTAYTTSVGVRTSEAKYVLDVATLVKDKLLAKGYAVVMARESLVNNFENSARSVFANNTSDIHVAIHIDAGTHGPGWYRPNAAQLTQANYTNWKTSGEKLGKAIENACATSMGKPVYPNLAGALTGYNYSTIPCTYIELMGVESKDMADFADTHREECADGIVAGIDDYFR